MSSKVLGIWLQKHIEMIAYMMSISNPHIISSNRLWHVKKMTTRATLSVAAYARHIYFQLESAV